MTAIPESLSQALAGRYQLERELGAGGMATVYLAHDLRHGRPVAVKVFSPELARSLGSERFLREIQLAAQLNHPHIVALIDSGEAGGLLYYLMPFVDGETLRSRIRRVGPLPIEDALHITREVADALGYAHRHGVIHRDIKPENILLADGHAFVADFGIARALDSAAEQLTQTGFALGTPAYMAPEQAVGNKTVDGRADLYALGCVLYEMLTGEPPYQGPTHQAILVKRFTEPIPAVRALRGDTPEWLAELVTRTLAMEPEARPADAASLITEISSARVTPVQLAVASTPAPTQAAGPIEDSSDRSLVVLPFENASPDPDNAWFADGLTEELIADLSRLRHLKVIARNSAMRLKGTTKDARTLGRELNVRYVLGGSVRKAGQNLRITAQLSDANDDSQVWAGKYSGTMDDVFELQEGLSRQIVTALQTTLSGAEAETLTIRPIRSPVAYELYLRAKFELGKTTMPAIDRAVGFLQEAEAIEGPSLQIIAALGSAYSWYILMGWETPFDALARVKELVARGKALSPESPEIEFVQGLVDIHEDRFVSGIRRMRNVLALIPTSTEALWYFATGVSGFGIGRPELCRQALVRLHELDPLSYSAHMASGLDAMMRGEYGASLAGLAKGLEYEPDSFDLRVYYAWSLTLTGSASEAEAVYLKLASEATAWSAGTSDWCRGCASGVRGDPAGVRSAMTPALKAFLDSSSPLWMAPLAEACALAGLPDQAMDYLERIFERGCVVYPHLTRSPALGSLRAFPRFEQFLPTAKAKWEAVGHELADLPPL